jgi:chemotaxis protein CheD
MDNWNYRDGKPHIYLKPGELCISKHPAVVTTVLGSCVSVTLFHPVSGFAAICHVLQPKCPRPDLCGPECQHRYRYAVCTIEEMARRLLRHGLFAKEIEVKLFGGAAMIGSQRSESLPHSVGQQNVKAAIETISASGLILKVMDVGGGFGRKIIFDTRTGEVFMKRLQRVVISETIT